MKSASCAKLAVANIFAPTIRRALNSPACQAATSITPPCMSRWPGSGATLPARQILPRPIMRATFRKARRSRRRARPCSPSRSRTARAKPGERILLAGFGSGCDALVFEMTGPMPGAESSGEAALSEGVPLDDYVRFLSLNGALELDWGVRSEFEQKAQATVLDRYGRDMLGFIGGRDAKGNVQFPKSRIPVRPDAERPGADAGRAPRRRAGADRLGHCRPAQLHARPAILVRPRAVRQRRAGDDGVHRRAMRAAFPSAIRVRMRLRIKSRDRRRGFRTYFWKAAPAGAPHARRLTTMASGIKDKVAIVGMGCTTFGEHWDKGPEDLIVEAFEEALADAKIARSEIQAAWMGNALDDINVGNSALPLAHALRLKTIPVSRVENMCATGIGGVARRGLCGRGGRGRFRAGARRREAEGHRLRRPAAAHQRPRQRSLAALWLCAGLLRPTRRRLCGETPAQRRRPEARDGARELEEPPERGQESARASAQGRRHGDDPESADDRRSARTLRLLRRLRRRGLRDRDDAGHRAGARIANPVTVKAVQLSASHGWEMQYGAWDGSYVLNTREAAKRAYAEAGVSDPRAELSLTEVHDCFSITELVTMEDLGLSDEGPRAA